ncbi:MAG: hypothetical protein EAZ42_07985 [Verrucomicrobia bacterium]|nr:MAG: hypothetical protein EAZ42_07985 [Verrucomicrobiota bacterium]
MNFPYRKNYQPHHRGASLVEVVIAMGILAVAIPLVFGAIAESGKTSVSSEAETRTSWLVPICLEEIEASRLGKSVYFPATKVGDALPTGGQIWALGFSSQGELIGRISDGDYASGTSKIGNSEVRYIANIKTSLPRTDNNPQTRTAVPMLPLTITIEYPASAPQARRQLVKFHSLIPAPPASSNP